MPYYNPVIFIYIVSFHPFLIDLNFNMKQHIVYIFLFSLAVNTACLEPSDVSLYEDGQPELVIEGRISDMPPPYYVRISSSVEPESEINSLPINEALVVISDQNGNLEVLNGIGEGYYEAKAIQGIVGDIYDIEVKLNNKTYNGRDSIRQAPSVDSIKSEYIVDTQREEGWYLVFYSHNAGGAQKYYKIELTVNDSAYNGYYDLIYFEEILGQKSQTWILPYLFELNDTVITTIHSITENMYEYYRGLSKQVENSYGNTQPPMINPPSNIDGALGYFQASSIWQDTTIIK